MAGQENLTPGDNPEAGGPRPKKISKSHEVQGGPNGDRQEGFDR